MSSIFRQLAEIKKGKSLKEPLWDEAMRVLGYDPDLLPRNGRQAEICRFILLGWVENYRASRQLVELGLISQEEADEMEEYCQEKFL
jgi:hypothetical protein